MNSVENQKNVYSIAVQQPDGQERNSLQTLLNRSTHEKVNEE